MNSPTYLHQFIVQEVYLEIRQTFNIPTCFVNNSKQGADFFTEVFMPYIELYGTPAITYAILCNAHSYEYMYILEMVFSTAGLVQRDLRK